MKAVKNEPCRLAPGTDTIMRRSSGWALLVLAVAACSGGGDDEVGGASAGCHADAECRAPLVCVGPSERGGCGVPPREACERATGCGEARPCHAIADACSDDGVGSACGPVCTVDSCGAGFVCGSDGACRAARCDEGVTCASYEVCDLAAIPSDAPVHARHSGCRRVTCANDASCPAATSCVNGICQAGTGTCGELVVLP